MNPPTIVIEVGVCPICKGRGKPPRARVMVCLDCLGTGRQFAAWAMSALRSKHGMLGAHRILEALLATQPKGDSDAG